MNQTPPRRKLRTLLCLIGVTVLAGCRAPAQAGTATDYRTSLTVKDIMDGLIDPSADAIWDSVATSSTRAGVEHKYPKTDEEWKALQHHAFVLIEASNALLIPGRSVALPGQKADAPRVELEPREIEARINGDRAMWVKGAHGLYDAAREIEEAIRARNVDRLFNSGAALDTACETCHLVYWYPAPKK